MILRLILVSLVFLSSATAKPKVVTLVSGERIIGEVLKSSNKETLRLKSDILGPIEFARSQIAGISDYEKVYTEDPFVVPPTAVAENKKAPVRADPKGKPQLVVEADYEPEIVDLLRGFRAPDHWSGSLRLGINFSQGDRQWTETYTRGNLVIEPEDSLNYYRFTGSYVYRETDRSGGDSYKSTDQADASFIYRHTFYENWFVQNSLSGRMDQIKGINREIQDTVGIGYKFEPNSQYEFLVGSGGGIEEFQTEKTDVDDGLRPVLNIFQEAAWKPFNRTSFVQKLNYYWNPRDREEYNYVFTAAVRVRLTDLLGFEFSYNESFDNVILDSKVRDDTQWRNALVVYF